MKLAGYARVSIEKDREGLNGQIERLEKWAEAHEEWTLKIFPETASASEGSKRPVFEKMMKEVLDGKYDGVAVEKIDRFGRSLSETIDNAYALRDAGKAFIVKDLGGTEVNTTTPTGKFIFVVFVAVAELERDFIYERMQRGRERAKKQGKHLGRYPMDLPIKEISEAHEMGASMKYLGKKYGVNPGTIRRHLHRFRNDEYPYGPESPTDRVSG